MLKRIFLSRTGMTFVTLGNGVFFGYYVGVCVAAPPPEPWALLGVLVFGFCCVASLITLLQKSRWGEDGMLKLRRTRFNARWMCDEVH